MLVLSWYTNFHYILYRLKTDAIKDAIRTYNNKGNYSVEYLTKEVITENVPITVLTSVSLISAVVIPLVGVIFGCFRCKGKCGGELIEEDLETNPKKKRRLFTAAISVCSAVIMYACAQGPRAHQSQLTGSRPVDFELSEVTGENMNFTIGLISQELSFLPVNISTPLIQRAQQSVDTLLNDVREMGFKLTDLRDSLKEISEIVLNLRNLGQRLRAGLNEARDNLTAAKEECTNDPPSVQAGACDKIPSWDDLQAEADFNQTIDDPSTLGYYPVSKAVLGNGILEIQLSDILRRCNQHETPWELLRLDRKFKFENMKTYKSKIPSLDEILMKLNDTLISIRLVSEDTRKAVNDTFSSGAQEIEYYKYSAEAAKPLLKNDLNLATFANNLETAAAEQVSASVAEKLRSTKDALNTLDDETVKTLQPLVVGLTPKSQLSMTKNMNAMNVANKIDLSRVSFRNILEGEGLVLANEVCYFAGKKSLARTLGWMDQYLEDTINKLQNDVGDCHPIRNVYDVIVSDFCDNAVGLVNTMWLCLGDIALLSVLTIILCVRLAKHLRRAKTGEEFYSEDLGSSHFGVPTRLFHKFPKLNRKRFTMPWLDDVELVEPAFFGSQRVTSRPAPQHLPITKTSVAPVVIDI
ncbi:PREDICTED: uncharacterized protein LOC107347089 [Acropora digitifera]|uniref:uncharacterized protein LOC107347089 n=1 Tax=Acropora digitifera TaxID=70779 RepID=UPI00077A6389|nr:PREDICTED: uncharacterized protein LOC107347089 [Acropora digitifera]